MFEAAELGQKVKKAVYKRREQELHTELLKVQRRLRGSQVPVIVIVSGVEGAGKGGVVNQLNTWLDARGLQTVAFWGETDEERERPRFWRFWRTLPPRGTVGILFGSWYTQPIVDRVYGRLRQAEFDRELRRIAFFERMLVDDGALIVKFWFHLTKKEQRRRLREDAKGGETGRRVSPLTKRFSKRYDKFARISERALRQTDTGLCPWHVIEAMDWRYCHLAVGETLLQALRQRLGETEIGQPAEPEVATSSTSLQPTTELTVLDRVDLTQRLEASAYSQRLAVLQGRLHRLAWKAWHEKVNTVAVFEGWDAAGKGGAIRRLTQGMDARLFRVISIAAPTDEEKAQHYLWRFWRHLPRAGFVTLYDRSWYGRVLVERVEDFASHEEWMRAYSEINEFEEQLCEHGVVLLKFWLHLSQDEQLRRFEERKTTPWKHHKITEEDWRNRQRWGEYEEAVNDMVARTSTEYAPWTLVAAEDKRWARLEVLESFSRRLEQALGQGNGG